MAVVADPAHDRAAFDEQADVDRMFADYERARLTLHPRPVHATRDALLCVSCGSARHSYNGRGSSDAGTRVCDECGVVQPGSVIFETMFGRNLPTRTSNYKRIHHWHERLSQLLLMESQIPAEHMLAIGARLLDGTHSVINKDTIRAVLRSLGLQVYIEKWLQIIERCTGVKPPCPGPVVMQTLDRLFIELQRPFDAHKLEGRRNFLNYNYVFCRLFQRMQCTKFCMFFPLIRSKAKLRALDEMWEGMTTSLGWTCCPLELVVPFAVRLDSPAASLLRLRAQIAHSATVVPRPVPSRTEFRKWDRRTSDWRPPKRAERRSVPFEQRPQTLALRLQRKRSSSASEPQSKHPRPGPESHAPPTLGSHAQ